MNLLDQLAESHIEAAIERGEFDNLAGTGRPQALDDDDHVPGELRAGYRLLKNAGYIPPEIETRRELASVEELLAATETDSREAARLTRRQRFLETRLAESRRGRALLADPDYGDRLRQRLTRAQ